MSVNLKGAVIEPGPPHRNQGGNHRDDQVPRSRVVSPGYLREGDAPEIGGLLGCSPEAPMTDDRSCLPGAATEWLGRHAKQRGQDDRRI